MATQIVRSIPKQALTTHPALRSVFRLPLRQGFRSRTPAAFYSYGHVTELGRSYLFHRHYHLNNVKAVQTQILAEGGCWRQLDHVSTEKEMGKPRLT